MAAPEEERFARNSVILAQAIEDGIARVNKNGHTTIDPTIVRLAATVIGSFNQHYLIQGFIENSHKVCWDQVRERNEEFFLQNAGDIFRYLPMDKVNLFRDLFMARDNAGKSVVPEALKMQIYALLDAMIKISIKYVHKQRRPYSLARNGTAENYYEIGFMNEVDLQRHATSWNIVLEFPLRC